MARLEVTRCGSVARAPSHRMGRAARARAAAVRLTWADDDFGSARRRRSSPTTACRSARSPRRLQLRCVAASTPMPGRRHAELLAACAGERDLPQALAAIDLALWDGAGPRAGGPWRALLERGRAARCPSTRRSAPRTARAAAAGGAAPRASAASRSRSGSATTPGASPQCAPRSGRTMAIRIDANGAWVARPGAREPARAGPGRSRVRRGTGQRSRRCARCARAVCRGDGRDGGRAGRRGSGAADAVCLNIARCGGISGCCATAAARAAGTAVYVASTFDGPLGVAAGVHAAAALASAGPCRRAGWRRWGRSRLRWIRFAPARRDRVPDGPACSGRRERRH